MSMYYSKFGTPEAITPKKFAPKSKLSQDKIEEIPEAYQISFSATARGCKIELPLSPDTAIYGFGLQLQGFNHKGRRLKLSVNSDPVAYNGDSHAPVPFFVTNKGFGIYIDTARYLEAYCGFIKKKMRTPDGKIKEVATNTDDLYAKEEQTEESVMMLEIPSAKGADVYLFEGETITDIVSEYNMFSGGGCSVPEWGLEPIYRCFGQSTEDDVMRTAEYFKEKNIPVGIIGLEPGWQSRAYSCSYMWNPEKYPEPEKLVSKLREMGYHINLWEHAFVNPSAPVYKELFPYSGNFEVWGGLVPDFSVPEAQEIFAKHHHDSFVEMGIDGFKLDECDSSDYTGSWSFPCGAEFPGGMDGEQYHSMFGTLYMQTMLKALDNTKTLSEVRNAGALAASYPFVLYSDLYKHEEFLCGTVNAGFSGLLWTPEVREGASRKDFLRRLQNNVFSVQCIINAWYCESIPWLEWDCEDEVREILEERIKLIPRLKEAFEIYRNTGKPPVRALVMDYTDDENTYSIDDEYLFCENLLVAPMTAEQDEREVYIPEGNWTDYRTGEPVKSGTITVSGDNIPVFERK